MVSFVSLCAQLQVPVVKERFSTRRILRRHPLVSAHYQRATYWTYLRHRRCQRQ